MAGKSVIKVLIDGDSKGLDQALGRSESKIGKFAKSMGKSFAIMGAAAVAGAALVGKALIDAGERASTSNARILQISESMGIFGDQAKAVTDRLVKLAEKTALQTGVDQNAIKATQAKLLTFRELAETADEVGGSFDRATAAAIDMAAAGFGDAEMNAVQLGKALNDPIKGITALARSGVTFTEAEKDMIKAMVEAGDTLGAQNLILEAIETQVGGTAAATANASDKMKVAFSQVQERLGQKLLPVFEKFTAFLIDKVFPAGERLAARWGPVLSSAFDSIGQALQKVGDVIGRYVQPILERIGKFFEENEQVVKTFFTVLAGGVVLGAIVALGAALAALLSPAVLITVGIAALVAGIQYAYQNFEGFRDVVDNVIRTVTDIVTSFIDTVQVLWAEFGDEILQHAENTWNYIRNAVESAMKIIQGVIDVVMGLIKGDWGRVWDGIKQIVQGVWDGITNLIRFALQTIGILIGLAWDGVKAATRAIWDGIKSTISSAIDGIVGFVTGIPGRITGTISTMWDGLKLGIDAAKDYIKLGIDAIVGFVTGLPRRIASGIGNGFEALWTNFKSVINRIIDGINSVKLPGVTIGGWDPPGPGPTIPSFTTPALDPFPHINRFHNGGMVPGIGEQLAILLGGERVLSRQEVAAGVGESDRPTFNVVFNGPTDAQMARRELEAMWWRTGAR